MSAAKKYYILETIYSLSLSFTKATFVIFFIANKLNRFEIGLIFGIFNLTVILAEPLTATYGELFGRKKSLLIGCILKVIAASMFFFGSSFPHFFIAEIFSAIALTFISGSIMAWAVDELKKEGDKRNFFEIFATCKKYKYMALIIGGLSGAYMGSYAISIPWAANGILFLILIFIASILMNTSTETSSLKKVNLFKTLNGYKIILQDKCLLALIASSFIASFALASIKLFWLPTVKENLGTSIAFLGWLWVGISGANFLGTHFIKPFVKKFSYKLDGLIVFSVFSTTFLLMMIFTINTWWTLLFYFLFEFGKPLYSTVKSDLINYQIPEDGRLTIISLHSLSIKLGASLGLISIGFLSDYWGLQQAWHLAAGIFFLNLFLYIIIHTWMLKIPKKREILEVN